MKKIYFIVLALICLLSCHRSKETLGENTPLVLKSSLSETKTSFFDLFAKAELIPLETNDQSLIKTVRKMDCHNDTVYVFDDDLFAVFIFDKNGKYVNKIHNIGEGPGEYSLIYDFCLDKDRRIINMLSPYCVHYQYGFDTQFIESFNLPEPPPSCYQFAQYSENSFVYWSMIVPEYKQGNINLISLKPFEKINNYSVKDHSFTQLYSSFPFFYYGDCLYFMRPFSNEVYSFTEKGFKTAYSWDFGKETMSIDVTSYKYPDISDPNEASMKFFNLFDNGEVKEAQYCYVSQNQTDKYYYTCLRFAHNVRKNLFYDKSSGRSILFEKTIEGVSFKPVYFSNEYLIFAVESDKKDMILPVLSSEDKEKWAKIEESDNPMLVKCYFK